MNSSVIRQKGESQNGGNRETKQVTSSEKRAFLNPYTHTYVCCCGLGTKSAQFVFSAIFVFFFIIILYLLHSYLFFQIWPSLLIWSYKNAYFSPIDFLLPLLVISIILILFIIIHLSHIFRRRTLKTAPVSWFIINFIFMGQSI